MRGRAYNRQHRKTKDDGEDKEDKIPKVSMDYFFMSKKDAEAKENPILGMVDEMAGGKFARAAGHKGIGTNGEMDWLIQDAVAELKAWGRRARQDGQRDG